MKILDGGLLSTVQDLGRFGFQAVGITPSGALDQISHRLANALVDNPENAATIETTLRGPIIRFTSDALVAVCGADLSATIDDAPVSHAHAIAVGAGAELRFGRRVQGTRGYVAVSGGVSTQEVMGSRSTYLRAAIGGLNGRALQKGDELPIGPASLRARALIADTLADAGGARCAVTARSIASGPISGPADEPVRFVRGPHFEMLSGADQHAFVSASFEISPRSDRMGYRLGGPGLSAGSGELLSMGVTWGTVQLPPSGQPIILMADRQTTGGYPNIATVITADLPRVAQLKPGDSITLSEVDVDGAQQILRDQDRRIDEIRRKIEGHAHRSEQ